MQHEEQTLPRSTGTWFVTASSYGKRLRRASNSIAELKVMVERGQRIWCDEVLEFITQVGVSPQPGGGVAASKIHITTVLDATTRPVPVLFDPVGSDIYFMDELDAADMESYLGLIQQAHKIAQAARAQKAGLVLAGNMPTDPRSGRA